jgi:uncharacterized membrane protein YqjE
MAFIEAILQICVEFFLQMFTAVIAEFGIRCMEETFKGTPSSLMAASGYAILGALAGLASVLVVPALLADPHVRIANLVVTPILAGVAICQVGAWRLRREQELVRLDRFAYGYVFALAMALVRFFMAK